MDEKKYKSKDIYEKWIEHLQAPVQFVPIDPFEMTVLCSNCSEDVSIEKTRIDDYSSTDISVVNWWLFVSVLLRTFPDLGRWIQRLIFCIENVIGRLCHYSVEILLAELPIDHRVLTKCPLRACTNILCILMKRTPPTLEISKAILNVQFQNDSTYVVVFSPEACKTQVTFHLFQWINFQVDPIIIKKNGS